MSEWQETEFGRIPTQWDLKKIADIKSRDRRAIAMGPFGSNIKAENFVNKGVPVIRGTNLNFAKYVGGDFVYLTEEKADELLGSNCKEGDLVFTHRGTIGQVGLIPSSFPRYVISQSGMKLSVDPDLMNNVFLFYFFKSEYGQHQILKYESQVGVPSISNPLTSLKEIEVPVPPLSEQTAIASILSSLDDKIDLLRRQNQTLEKMAETLFRQWFVEEVKEEWEEGIISDLAFHSKSSVQPQKNKEVEYLHYSIPSFDNAKNPVGEFGREIQSNKYLVPKNCFLFSKLNPHKDKRVWLLQDEVNDHSICSTEFQIVKPKNDDYLYFLYGWLTYPEIYNDIASGVGGTSGSHQRIDPSSIFNAPCPQVSDSLVRKYNLEVKPIFQKQVINQTQIRTLTLMRDNLLPKLMSGEVRMDFQKV